MLIFASLIEKLHSLCSWKAGNTAGTKMKTHRALSNLQCRRKHRKSMGGVVLLLDCLFFLLFNILLMKNQGRGDIPRWLRPWSMAGGPMQELPIPKSRVLSRVQPSYTIVAGGYKVKIVFMHLGPDPNNNRIFFLGVIKYLMELWSYLALLDFLSHNNY